jgi:negative regulator of flagellin synthesis FlgM
MSYTSGIGGSQQDLNALQLAGAGKTAASAKTDAAAQTAAGGSGTNSGSAKDVASLSTAGALLAQALSGSDVRADKVAALQSSIAAGTYNVSSSDVADKLIGSLLQ